MHCKTCKKLINDYTGGVLAEQRVAEVQAHLAECPECQAAQLELAAAVGLVKGLDRGTTSPDFMRRLRAKIQIAEALERRPPRSGGLWERIVPAKVARPLVLAAVVLLLIVVMVGPGSQSGNVDLAQTDFAKFCAAQHTEYATSPPIKNQMSVENRN